MFSFLLFRALVWAGESCSNDNSDNGFALVDHVYKSFFCWSFGVLLHDLYHATSNYNLADKTCEFHNGTKHFRPKYFAEKSTYIYAENPDSGGFFFSTHL